MSLAESFFEIIEENKCPLYELGDRFSLSGKAVLLDDKNDKTFITTAVIKMPHEKPVCRILVGDITGVLIKYESMNTVNRCIINCSGCSGLIRLEYNRDKKPILKKEDQDARALANLLYMFPIFKAFNEKDIRELIPILKLKRFPEGHTIIRKGEPGTNLYIIVSGKAEVLVEDDICIGVMGKGDVFGEISLLIGTPVGATIRVSETATVLFISGKDFRKVLNKFPTLQMYFARLLAERLARTNDERIKDFGSGMIGNLSEMPPSELLQTLNLNHKTGVLTMGLSHGEAILYFREGNLVGVTYGKKDGKEAFFEILKAKEGRYKFVQGLPSNKLKAEEIADFMWLLMEGIRRMDEENNNNDTEFQQ